MVKYCLFLVLLFPLVTVAKEVIPDMKIEEISEGIYLHQSFHRTESFGVVSSNGLVVVESGNAFIIDTPWSEQDTESLVAWIVKNNFELQGSISTHSHEDRTAGIHWLNTHSIPTYATKLTNEILKANNKALAKNTLLENESDLFNGTLEVFYPGGGHSIDNIVVWMPKSNILFGGCFTRSLESKSLGYTGEAVIEEWSSSVEKVLKKYTGAKIVVPGHGKIGDLALLKHSKALADSAFRNSRATASKSGN